MEQLAFRIEFFKAALVFQTKFAVPQSNRADRVGKKLAPYFLSKVFVMYARLAFPLTTCS